MINNPVVASLCLVVPFVAVWSVVAYNVLLGVNFFNFMASRHKGCSSETDNSLSSGDLLMTWFICGAFFLMSAYWIVKGLLAIWHNNSGIVIPY